MRRFSFVIIAALILTVIFVSCQRQLTQEEKVKKAFTEYVETDFGDPSTFVSVTKVEPSDSINAKSILTMLDSMGVFKVIMTDKQLKQYDEYYNKLKSDTNYIKTYKVNVRVRLGKDKKELGMRDFYYVDENGKVRIQDHVLQMDEIPELYQDAYKYIEGILNYSTVLRMNLGIFPE